MANSNAVLATGTTLQNGKYRIEKVLGQGGFGITYLVTQTALKADFVVKEFFLGGFCIRKEDLSVIPQSMKPEDFLKFRERFLQEAQYLYKLRGNKHIVEVTDYFEENGTAYMVMPFIADENLEQYTRRQPDNRLQETEVLEIARQLISALKDVHSQQILHRDIKPSNILRKKDGSVVLIDFGSAREVLAGDISQTMSTIISAGFAPPEQYNVSAKRGPFSDIYSLGATLYRLITGKTPLDATSRSMDDLEAPITFYSGISPKLNQIIMKSMELRPQNRYQTIDEITTILFQEQKPEDNKTVIVTNPEQATKVVNSSNTSRVSINPSVKASLPSTSPYPTPFYEKPIVLIPLFVLLLGGLGWGVKESGLLDKPKDNPTDTLTPPTTSEKPDSNQGAFAKSAEVRKADSLKPVQRHKFVEDSIATVIKTSAGKENETRFLSVKAEADNAFKAKQYKVAALKYDMALMYKPADSYCAKQKAICERKIKEAEIKEQQVVVPMPTPNIPTNPPTNQNTVTKGKLYNLTDDTGQPFDYEGEIKNGKPNGKGTVRYKNGSFCEGTLVDGHLNGYCECGFSSGDRFMGNTRKDRMNGQGKYIFKNGNRYEGNFVEDRMEGKGKLTFPNGEYFTGNFSNDLPYGPIEYHDVNGRIITGTYKDGQFYPDDSPTSPSQKLQKIFKPKK